MATLCYDLYAKSVDEPIKLKSFSALDIPYNTILYQSLYRIIVVNLDNIIVNYVSIDLYKISYSDYYSTTQPS